MELLNPYNFALEFSIQVSLISKDYQDAPPKKVTVLAILNDPKTISLTSSSDYLLKAHCHDEVLLTFGNCNTYESIRASIEIRNNSYQCQEYGFLDLPDVNC